MTDRRNVLAALMMAIAPAVAVGHDIPDARVDRSIQATLGPGKLRVDYEVSLAELTLVQDIRRLVEDPSAQDRRGWFELYGREVGPLDAKGLLVRVDEAEVDLRFVDFALTIEGHPRFTFHFEADLPDRGRLALVDTNYEAAEGTSRLAIRGVDGVEVRGDSLPPDVSAIPIRPKWQLTDSEERRTRRVRAEYGPSTQASKRMPSPDPPKAEPPTPGLSRLLDGDRAWPALIVAALILGAAHAIQPGHGKTLVAASSLGPGGGPWRGAALGLLTAMAHLSSVALIALAVWLTRSSRLGEIHAVLGRSAGFAIAAIGLWRLGRHLGEFDERDDLEIPEARSLLALGLAGGLVPCWDAVALVVVAQGIGRLGMGLILLAAFSLGMALVLVLVGALASRFRSNFEREGPWGRRLGIAGSLVLAGIGISLLL